MVADLVKAKRTILWRRCNKASQLDVRYMNLLNDVTDFLFPFELSISEEKLNERSQVSYTHLSYGDHNYHN